VLQSITEIGSNTAYCRTVYTRNYGQQVRSNNLQAGEHLISFAKAYSRTAAMNVASKKRRIEAAKSKRVGSREECHCGKF